MFSCCKYPFCKMSEHVHHYSIKTKSHLRLLPLDCFWSLLKVGAKRRGTGRRTSGHSLLFQPKWPLTLCSWGDKTWRLLQSELRAWLELMFLDLQQDALKAVCTRFAVCAALPVCYHSRAFPKMSDSASAISLMCICRTAEAALKSCG